MGLAAAALLLVRSAWRLKGHFHDLHYRPVLLEDGKRRTAPGDQPLSWWAVKRVTKYSGRINLWLAGGFAILYAIYVVFQADWPPWLGQSAFEMFDRLGGIPMLATALVLLAAVPAAFQYGLWDSNVHDRCRRLELLLLTDLDALSYWQAAAAAAWKRGKGYFVIALVLWTAGILSGQVTILQALAGLAAGMVLWALYFAVGFWAFTARTSGEHSRRHADAGPAAPFVLALSIAGAFISWSSAAGQRVPGDGQLGHGSGARPWAAWQRWPSAAGRWHIAIGTCCRVRYPSGQSDGRVSSLVQSPG